MMSRVQKGAVGMDFRSLAQGTLVVDPDLISAYDENSISGTQIEHVP